MVLKKVSLRFDEIRDLPERGSDLRPTRFGHFFEKFNTVCEGKVGIAKLSDANH